MANHTDSSSPAAIFVYGRRRPQKVDPIETDSDEDFTLVDVVPIRPRPKWPHRPEAIVPANVEGNLVGYGAIRVFAPGRGRVPGILLRFKPEHMPAMLDALDARYGPEDDHDAVFKRVRVTAIVDGVPCEAWTYGYGFAYTRLNHEHKPTSHGNPTDLEPAERVVSSAERNLAARRTETMVQAIKQLRREHADNFKAAFRLLDRYCEPQSVRRFWGHEYPKHDRLETDREVLNRFFLSAFPDPDQDMHPLVDIFGDFRSRSEVRWVRARCIRAAAFLTVLLLGIHKSGPKDLALSKHRIGGFPWQDQVTHAGNQGRGDWLLNKGLCLEGPYMGQEVFERATDAVEVLDSRLANELTQDPYRNDPPIPPGAVKFLRKLETYNKPVHATALGRALGDADHKKPLRYLEQVGYVSRQSPRGPVTITPEGRERLVVMDTRTSSRSDRVP